MGKYTVISDTSKTLIELLKAGLTEEKIVSPENIGICDPGERENFIVGVHPYDIKENSEVRPQSTITMPDGSVKNPPFSINMSVMISVVSKAELSARGLDEQRILGKIVQILGDNPRLPKEYMPDALKKSNETITIQMASMEFEDKVKIWSMFNQPYHLCCFYTIGPITIESAVIKKTAPRVGTISIDSEIK